MIQADLKKTIAPLIGVAIAALLLWAWNPDEKKEDLRYFTNQGPIFGTFYTIKYEATQDLETEIKQALQDFDNSLSMFNPHSILSAVNANRDTVTNEAFETMFAQAKQVYELSQGAFDITVAPLVNYWGFGRTQNTDRCTDRIPTDIDSIRAFVGMEKVRLIDHHIVKADPRVQLDGGAVAKGQSCDMVAQVLRQHGSQNYLIEIGGEVVAHGHNAQGKPWGIGVCKPKMSNDGVQEDFQEILHLTDACIATSGNYRNFNEAGGHTIDPRIGRPIQQEVYSATVVSSSCMRADALATACMVLGETEALAMIERAEDAACLLIVKKNDQLEVVKSPKWEEMTTK